MTSTYLGVVNEENPDSITNNKHSATIKKVSHRDGRWKNQAKNSSRRTTDDSMMKQANTSNTVGYRKQSTDAPSDERSWALESDWYDPTDGGRAHVNFVGGGRSIPSSFQTRESLILDHNETYHDGYHVVEYRQRKNLLVLGFLAMLALTGAITTSIVLAQSSKKEHDQVDTDKKLTSNFHPISESTVSACSLTSVQTVSGLKLCQSMCSVADCCKIPNGKELSCYSSRKKDCDDYRRVCSAMDLSSDKKNNETDLQIAEQIIAACGSTSLLLDESQRKECQDLCTPHQCCYAEEESKNCHLDESKKCHLYTGCYTLNDSKDPSVFNMVRSNCTDEALTSIEGFKKCNSVCSEHLCCVSPEPNEHCADEHVLECASYSPCAILTNSSMSIETKAPMSNQTSTLSNIGSKCNINILSSKESYDECHSACESHLCCFSPDSDKNCADTHSLECASYSSCSFLASSIYFDEKTPVASQPSIHKEVKAKCSKEVLTSTEKYNECYSICESHLCCVSTDSNVDCVEENSVECSSYTPCAILNDSILSDQKNPVTTQPTMSDMVQSNCSAESLISIESIHKCKSICESHSCCTSPDPSKNCAEKISLECAAYTSCANLNDLSSIDEKAPVANQPSIFEMVRSKCTDKVLTSFQSYDECHSICEPHLCCILPDSDKNCAEENSGECSSYKPCAILNSVSNFKPEKLIKIYKQDPDKIDNACTENNVKTAAGMKECHDMCSDVLCCFVHPELKSNCIDSLGDDICGLYGACKILAIDDSLKNDTKPKLGDVEEFCTPEYIKTNGQKECQEKCDEGSCCFSSGVGKCDLDKDWCKPYVSSCNVVYPELSDLILKDEEVKQGLGNNLQNEMTDICSLENFSTQFGPDLGKDICHRMCEPFKCCFENNLSCGLNEDDCAKVDVCKDLFIYEDIEDQVEIACAEDMNMEKCKTLCDEHLCCFDDTKSSGCHETSCGLYNNCAVLLSLNN